MDVLKIATAGSVDDGKSTLIGRLLYDTKSLTDDKLEAIKRNSKQKGYDYLDFSLATDGLVAEREQGITIDVAHIYFSTKARSYIIADSPGHIEYTRNMVTGASTAQVSIVLIDARNGVVEQTYRHFFITNLLRVKHIIVAVNKMDLVDFDQEIYDRIKNEFKQVLKKSDHKNAQVSFVPISALKGDNVVVKSSNMAWFTGKPILSHLEDLTLNDTREDEKMRLPVQTVIRPKTTAFHDYRGYAGKVYGGSISVGDQVTILPSKKTSSVKTIDFYDQSYKKAHAGSAVTVTLEDAIHVARGDVFVKTEDLPKEAASIRATICWMNTAPLASGAKYFIRHNSNTVLAKVATIVHRVATDFTGNTTVSALQLNEIGLVELHLSKAIHYDSYAQHRTNGSFILIDTDSNATAGVGFIN